MHKDVDFSSMGCPYVKCMVAHAELYADDSACDGVVGDAPAEI